MHQTSFVDEKNQTVIWTLREVVDVDRILNEFDDGAEIYARHFRNYRTYRAFEVSLSDHLTVSPL